MDDSHGSHQSFEQSRMNLAAFLIYPSYPSSHGGHRLDLRNIFRKLINEMIQYKTKEKDWRQQSSVLNQEP
jgi:hypothetical protein